MYRQHVTKLALERRERNFYSLSLLLRNSIHINITSGSHDGGGTCSSQVPPNSAIPRAISS